MNDGLVDMDDDDGKHITYEYEWFHIPTQKRGENRLRVSSRLEFLEALNKWNRNGFNQWIYTEK